MLRCVFFLLEFLLAHLEVFSEIGNNRKIVFLQDEGIVTAEQISLVKRNSCGKSLDIARKVRFLQLAFWISNY